MTTAEHIKCAYCGKDLGRMSYEGQEHWDSFCSKKHAEMFEEGKIFRPKHKRVLSTVESGKF